MKFSVSKKYFVFSLLLSVLLVLSACGSTESDDSVSQASALENDGKLEVTELRYQGYANIVTFPELAEDLGYLGDIKLEWVGNVLGGPQDLQAVALGETDFGGAFNGTIVNSVAAGAKIKAVFASLGADEETYKEILVLEDSPITSAKDLIGKKVGVNSFGAIAEYMVKDYLTQGGLTEKEINEVTLVVIPPANTEQSLRMGQLDAAFMYDIHKEVAVSRGGLRSLTSDKELWGVISTASNVLHEDFIKKNPNTTKQFLEGVAKATDWAQTMPREEVIARMKKIIEKRDRNEDTTLVTYWKSTSVAGKGGLLSDKEFSMWIEKYKESGILKNPNIKVSDLYTNEFNPFNE